jgi:hypothetical protein
MVRLVVVMKSWQANIDRVSLQIKAIVLDRISTHPSPTTTPDSQWEQRLKTWFARLAASRLPVRVDSSSSLLTLDGASKGKHSRRRKVS